MIGQIRIRTLDIIQSSRIIIVIGENKGNELKLLILRLLSGISCHIGSAPLYPAHNPLLLQIPDRPLNRNSADPKLLHQLHLCGQLVAGH